MSENFMNLTPHTVNLNDGREFRPSGQVARVTATLVEVNQCPMQGEDCGHMLETGRCSQECCRTRLFKQSFGEVTGLPDPAEGVVYVVSGLVLSALNGSRPDVVAPATSHHECRRNEHGQVASVPGFVR